MVVRVVTDVLPRWGKDTAWLCGMLPMFYPDGTSIQREGLLFIPLSLLSLPPLLKEREEKLIIAVD